MARMGAAEPQRFVGMVAGFNRGSAGDSCCGEERSGPRESRREENADYRDQRPQVTAQDWYEFVQKWTNALFGCTISGVSSLLCPVRCSNCQLARMDGQTDRDGPDDRP